VEVRSPEMWTDLRTRIAGAGSVPESLRTLCGTIETSHNLAAKPNEQRARWAGNIGLPHLKQTAETVYFVGCVTSFYPMVQDVARSFARILNSAGIDFAILGGEEWCCGYPLMSAGQGASAARHMEHNIERVTAMGAKRVIVTCPGCYRMWKHDYGRITGKRVPLEVTHSTVFLAGLVERQTLAFGAQDAIVTYHDPCDLGRNAGVYDEPRYIIGKIPGLRFAEIEPNRRYTNCCGSGGDLLASNQALSLEIAGRKVDEILATGAASVVTACPSCIRGITMAKVARKAQFSVLDIAQLAWNAMVK
jgi:Fe-S oxidoreductase